MNQQENLIDQLEEAVAGKSVSRRADVLKRVADLFFVGSGKYSEAQVELFDDVMTKLIASVEVAARARFGARLAAASDAPANVVRLLAFDPAIEVAGEVLSRSECLSDEDLIANAQTMSQDHLLAISKRSELKEGLTDVLITRGNREVLVSTATNAGSRLSSSGLTALVGKAHLDERLTLSLWSRPDVPRQDMVNLFRQASEGLRLQLEAANPRQVQSIRVAISAASERVHAIARTGSVDYQQAQIALAELYAEGKLGEPILVELLERQNFDGIALAMALMCDLPVGLVERALAQGRYEQILLLAKAIELSWKTTLALLQFQANGKVVAQAEVDQYFATFSRMQVKTAQTALQFYRLRESGGKT
ncbi:MAG: DUF2336 domain-containing protein [Xanthobacteraceae bacterium]